MINGLLPVINVFRQRGHHITVYLQRGHSAAGNYERGERLRQDLKDLPVHIVSSSDCQPIHADAVLLAMSPVVGQNLEIEILRRARAEGRPVYAVEEVSGGRMNTQWRDHYQHVTAIFTPLPTEDHRTKKEIVVGSLPAAKWQGVSVAKLAQQARIKLRLTTEPVLYFFPSPEPESPAALCHLGLLLAQWRNDLPSNLVVMVNRHRRDRSNESRPPIVGQTYQAGLAQCAQGGFTVFDNSPEYSDLPADDHWAIQKRFRPPEFLTYQEMLAITADNGAALTFFGTDGLMVAPCLGRQGIYPILWLDPRYGGKMLYREKALEHIDLAHIPQPGNDQMLKMYLCTALHPTLQDKRKQWCGLLDQWYKLPVHEPAQLIADQIIKDLISGNP